MLLSINATVVLERTYKPPPAYPTVHELMVLLAMVVSVAPSTAMAPPNELVPPTTQAVKVFEIIVRLEEPLITAIPPP